MAEAPDIPPSDQCAPLPAGGYECEFVDSLPDSLACPICLLPFRDPHLLSCCGAKYCESCIGRVKATGQPCPLCKQPFNTMLDKWFKRKVLDMKVRCSRKKDGCEWQGDLRDLEKHEREECEWALIQCRYQCGGRIPRRQLAEHEVDECPQRPVDIKMVRSFMHRMEVKLTCEKERHENEMTAVREELKKTLHEEREHHMRELAIVRDELKNVLQEQQESHKKELDTMEKTHTAQVQQLEQMMTRKLDEQVTAYQQLMEQQRKKYEAKMEQLEQSLHSKLKADTEQQVVVKLRNEMKAQLNCPPCEFSMTGYSQHKRDNDIWYSPPFYTRPKGYKMCLKVEANGNNVSVRVHLMRGEHDGNLNWPFKGSVTIQLLDQKKDREHIERTISFSSADSAGVRVTSGEINAHGWGWSHFVFCAEVVFTTLYLHNDCLKWRVTKVVHSF